MLSKARWQKETKSQSVLLLLTLTEESYRYTPNGKQVSFTTMDFLTIIDGKVTEEWSTADIMGLMQQQLGAIPAPSTAGTSD